MAIDVFSNHAAGVLAVQNMMGDSCPVFTWNGQEYKANPGGAERRKNLTSGGFSLDCDLAITVHMAQFGDTTAAAQQEAMVQTRLTYLGQSYKIESVKIFPGEKLIRLLCNHPAQSA